MEEISDAENESPELARVFKDLLKVINTAKEVRIDALEEMRQAFPVGLVNAGFLATFIGPRRYFNLVCKFFCTKGFPKNAQHNQPSSTLQECGCLEQIPVLTKGNGCMKNVRK